MPTAAKRVRQSVPDEKLTLKSIRDGIPKHYFEQNTAKSFYYLLRDVVQILIAGSFMYYYAIPWVDTVTASIGTDSFLTTAASNLFKFAVWSIFWFVQGVNGIALWVLAHECGHRAFSPSRLVNDAIGMVLHSFLLVPYHSWRISHGNHHKHTNHNDLDTVFVPVKIASDSVREALNEAPILSLFYITLTFTVGWPLYLCCNMTGQKYNRRANHFEPSSPLFRPSDGGAIIESDLGVLAVAAIFYGIVYAGYATWYDMLIWYFIPYLWVNFWLIYITYLQHTDVRLPHYDAENWSYVRGALATVDRDYGFVLNNALHHINDSHAVHHTFSTMPHYNAIEVTRKYLRNVVPDDVYLTDDRSLTTMLWESWTNCRVIRPADGVAWFRK